MSCRRARRSPADWYDHVYLPGVAALRREELPEVYAYRTDADLFLWVYKRRRALRVDCPETDFEEAARDARATKVSGRYRRRFLRDKSTPCAAVASPALRES